MLVRDINWVLRHGVLSADVDNKASYAYVGGSPITINSSGVVTANLGATARLQETSFVAVAWHSIDFDDAISDDLATIIFPPAILNLEQGTEYGPITGTAYADGSAPWKSGQTYNIGSLLRPILTTGTPAYAVWTPESYQSETANVVYPCPAKIIGRTGSAASPTQLQILIGTFYKES